jgi:flavin-dependent dehydrogenase
MDYDVAIIGGGPGGSTVASLVKKYLTSSRVIILERERFPREHVGESQLPIIGGILHEMGAWDKVEAANFPIKIGATYRWGNTDDLWDFEFLSGARFVGGDRPAPYDGERRLTAFQVERSTYDKILLDHAKSLGVEVHEETPVTEVDTSGSEVLGLRTGKGTVTARHYVDASGNVALLRRALGIEVDQPSRLKNVAFWSYWDNAEWAVTLGRGGTRVNVMSLGYGWIWFIPISESKASVGLVVPADYYKAQESRPEEMYMRAIREEKLISHHLRNATRIDTVHGTKDWSFVSKQLAGPNWYLVGEAAGFADPILAAGLTLTHSSARECAYNLVSHLSNLHDEQWLKSCYEETQIKRIRQHIRFADYWYTANGHFSELKEHVAEIAADAGLTLEPNQAFQWLGTGGFVNDDWRTARIATFALGATKQLTQFFGTGEAGWEINRYSHFQLNVDGAQRMEVPAYHEGQILILESLQRRGETLPLVGAYKAFAEFLKFKRSAHQLVQFVQNNFLDSLRVTNAMEVLEAMVCSGWVKGTLQPGAARFNLATPTESEVLHPNRDELN